MVALAGKKGAGTVRRKGWVQVLCLAPPGGRTANTTFLESSGETRAGPQQSWICTHAVSGLRCDERAWTLSDFPRLTRPAPPRKPAPADLARF